MKVGIYARESSSDLNKAPPIEAQIARGKQWAAENNHEIVIEWIDNGYSGGDWTRPGWLQSINDAKRHAIQIVWVWNQDRIARDTEQFLFYYRKLQESKVNIYEDTAMAFINMDDLGGRVKHQTLAQAAEIFRLVTSDKVKQAYRRKKLKGEHWGKKFKEFDKEKAVALRSEGKGYRTIANSLGISYQTVRRYLIGLQSNTKNNNDLLTQKPHENETGIM